jgi:hypothetical protein
MSIFCHSERSEESKGALAMPDACEYLLGSFASLRMTISI